MAPFRIREDARKWFKDLRDLRDNGFSTDFDSFYFCFMAGITANRKIDASTSTTAELVDYFPDRYKTRGKLLVALFLSQELKHLGVDMSEKRFVHAEIARLVMPEALNNLSDVGVREFNKYAHGGFEVLLEWFDDRPRTLETFLRVFKRKIDKTLIYESTS